MAEPSVLTIEELTGEKRRVELMGSGLPFRGANWGSSNRLVTTWNPGNGDDATQHVLGPMELPSSWQGEWRTTRLVSKPCVFYGESGDPIRMTRASTIRDVLDAILRSGAKLRVMWEQGERKIVREGLAEEWDFAHDRMDDIGWTITWAWSGRGTKKNRVVSFRQDQLAASLHEALVAVNELTADIENAKIAKSKKGVVNSADTFSLGDIEAMANAPFETMKSLSQFANNVASRVDKIAGIVKTVISTPTQLASQAIDVASNAVATFNQIIDEMSRTMPENISTLDNKVSSMTKLASYHGSAQTQAELTAAVMAQFERELRRKQSGLAPGGRKNDQATTRDILTVHLSKQGDTFASISQRYYKTPDKAAELASKNAFPSYQVAPPPGNPIIIPKLTALDAKNKV